MNQSLTTVLLITCLGGCGGGGGGTPGAGIDPRLARLETYDALQLRVLGNPAEGVASMPVAAIGDLPTAGATMFQGTATIRVENGTNPIALFGDASVTVDFGTQQGSGSLTSFFGNTTGGTITDYMGSLALTAQADQQDLALEYRGELSSSDGIFGFDGRMDGVFLGNPLGAFAASDIEARVDHDGTNLDATLVVIGEVSEAEPEMP